MRFLSLFSGIEAASMAWTPLGWEPAAFSEIEPFPCSVLRHHYPHVPNLGDVTRITRQQVEALGRIDLVCGGFPCQDLSVAGKRKGLMNADGSATRSGLFFDAMRIAEWARARWTVLENVPGLFSSNDGRDFAAVVGEMAGCEFDVPPGGWENAGVAVGPLGLVEWTTLDAQYVRVESHPRAVPQRRRRVFIVRDSGSWTNRPPLFLERESLRGHPAPRREAGQVVAGTVGTSSSSGRSFGSNPIHDNLVSHALRGEGFDASKDGTGGGTPLIPAIVGQAMSSKWAKGTAGPAGPAGDEHHNLIPVPFDTTQITSPSNYIAPRAGDARHPLAAGAHAPCIAFPERMSGTQCASSENVSPSMGALNPTAIAIQERADAEPNSGPGGKGWRDDGAAYTLEARHRVQAVATQRAVRRLTPLECERLMGFPDGHTAVPHKGKDAADGLRYRALGNSWAVNVATWVGTRIQQVDKCLLEHQTQQALEQGVGRHTTPTTYERAHAAPGS